MYAIHILEYKSDYVITFRPTDYSVCSDFVCRRATVTMILHLDKSKTTTKFFLYRDTNNEWKIWNLTIEGINLGIAYRNSYASIFEKVGMDGLLQKLRRKVQ